MNNEFINDTDWTSAQIAQYQSDGVIVVEVTERPHPRVELRHAFDTLTKVDIHIPTWARKMTARQFRSRQQ